MNLALGGGRLCQYIPYPSSYSRTRSRFLGIDWIHSSVSAWDESHHVRIEQRSANEMSRQPDLSLTLLPAGYRYSRSKEEHDGLTIITSLGAL